MQKVLKLFDKMPQKEAIPWNAVISRCLQNGFFGNTLEFCKQLAGVKIDTSTFVTVLPSRAKNGSFRTRYRHPSKHKWKSIFLGSYSGKLQVPWWTCMQNAKT